MTSPSAKKLRDQIEKAIEDHKLTRAEYDQILNVATEDGFIDRDEQVLLSELQDMIENKFVKLVAK